jgi:hypothetical protein
VIGQLGRSVIEYYDMTLGEILLAQYYYQQREIEDWKRTRMLMFVMVKMWGDPKRSAHSPEELLPLMGDVKKYAGLTKEEITAELENLRNQGYNV